MFIIISTPFLNIDNENTPTIVHMNKSFLSWECFVALNEICQLASIQQMFTKHPLYARTVQSACGTPTNKQMRILALEGLVFYQMASLLGQLSNNVSPLKIISFSNGLIQSTAKIFSLRHSNSLSQAENVLIHRQKDFLQVQFGGSFSPSLQFISFIPLTTLFSQNILGRSFLFLFFLYKLPCSHMQPMSCCCCCGCIYLLNNPVL